MTATNRVRAFPRVAFLRGINVGGSGILKMEDLRRLAAAAGLRDVTTIGASGNVLYASTVTPDLDAQRLTTALVGRMGRGTVVVRDGREMTQIVERAPFVEPEEGVPDKWRFVALLEHPSDAPLPELPDGSPIRFVGRSPREIFYRMSEPTGQAIAMVGRLERTLGTSMTVRNWNVVRAINERLNQES